MVKKSRAIQRRKARTSINKIPVVNEDCLKAINSSDAQLLYEFIYGKKRHEIGTLMRGFRLLFEKSKDPDEKQRIIILIENIYRAKLISCREKINQFESRTGKSLAKEAKNAKKGNDASLFRLVGFDKNYLFETFIRERIDRAQSEEDSMFFHDLGEAIKRKTGKLDDLRRHQNVQQGNFRKLVRLLKIVGSLDFSEENIPKQIEQYVEKQKIEFGEDLPNFDHLGVIKRSLTKMGVLEG